MSEKNKFLHSLLRFLDMDSGQEEEPEEIEEEAVMPQQVTGIDELEQEWKMEKDPEKKKELRAWIDRLKSEENISPHADHPRVITGTK